MDQNILWPLCTTYLCKAGFSTLIIIKSKCQLCEVSWVCSCFLETELDSPGLPQTCCVSENDLELIFVAPPAKCRGDRHTLRFPTRYQSTLKKAEDNLHITVSNSQPGFNSLYKIQKCFHHTGMPVCFYL